MGEFFYSRLATQGETTLDDLITTLEGPLDEHLTKLRSAQSGSAVDSQTAALLVSHLMIRTAHIRAMSTQMLSGVFQEFDALLRDVARARLAMGVDRPISTQIMAKALDRAMLDLPLIEHDFPPALFRRIIQFFLREAFNLMLPEMVQTAGSLMPPSLQTVDLMRDTHNFALEQVLSENKWQAELAMFKWHVLATENVILPDAVVLATNRHGELGPMVVVGLENTSTVYMPITSKLVLVGSRAGLAAGLPENFNEDAAALCSDFFVAKFPIVNDELLDSIGTRCTAVVVETVKGVISEFEGHSLLTKSANDTPLELNVAAHINTAQIQLTFVGFAVDGFVAPISKLLSQIFHELASGFPFHKLDGMTFAADYYAAANQLEQGTSEPDEGIGRTDGFRHGIAKLVRVVREGEKKFHIVFDAGIALRLIDVDPEFNRHAAYTIRKMLAQIMHAHRNELSLLDAIELLPSDPVERLLAEVIWPCPCSYFSSLESAHLYPEGSELHATLAHDSLKYTRKVVAAAIEDWRENDDMDQLLEKALPCISSVLTHCADWLGHRDGASECLTNVRSDLPTLLKSDELVDWLELYGADLKAHCNAIPREKAEMLSNLVRHAERIMWLVGLFPWPSDENTVFVSVP